MRPIRGNHLHVYKGTSLHRITQNDVNLSRSVWELSTTASGGGEDNQLRFERQLSQKDCQV